jgi:hypothetical protein
VTAGSFFGTDEKVREKRTTMTMIHHTPPTAGMIYDYLYCVQAFSIMLTITGVEEHGVYAHRTQRSSAVVLCSVVGY